MNAKIHIGFVTDIEELMLRARQERMAVRKQAWAELTTAVATFAGVALLEVAELLGPTYRRSAATG